MICVNSVSVYPKSISLKVGTWSYAAYAEVCPSDADCKEVQWHSDNSAVASVNASSGYICANGVGTAHIYATATDGSGCSDYLTVTVSNTVPVTSVTLNRSSLSLEEGQNASLSATVCPDNATNKNVNWTSSNNSVATVSNGIVSAIAKGSATITATAADGSGKIGTCTVTVKKKAVYYKIVNKENNKVLNIQGEYILELKPNQKCTLYSPTGANEQIWRIDSISSTNNCYIRSYVDESYGLNAYRSQIANYQCDVYPIAGNETDAAVYFLPQGDGSYKIKLANYSNYYLTATSSADGADIRWQPEDSAKNQHWKLVNFDTEQCEAEKNEYHIIPYSDINLGNKRALQVDMNTPNEGNLVNKTKRLKNDEPLELATFSYINKQKWLIKGTDTSRQICTAHGDNYHLCKKSDAVVYVSDDDSYESFITVANYDTSQDLVMIKLTNSNLYLTLSDVGIIWSSLNNNSTAQIWKIVAKPDNIHNGADTASRLYNAFLSDKDKTVRACKLGGEKFVVRYYADADEISQTNKILSVDEADSLHNHDIKIVSVYQDSANYASYFNASEGEKDATIALSLARERNQPAGSAIYFAVDYDASNNDMENIKAYFSAIKSVFNNADVKYKVGVYGNGLTCSTIKGLYAEYSWLNCATGHQGYAQYDSPDNYNIKQAEEIVYNNITFDDNISVGNDYGQW